ncbi:hypothetical protein PsorP6_012763 [Peronosclerospora sorghi]|uniref:Uncharacterized protein n=1 Tax=Peronosclerospora sorghi TaxID=230839 RepID=A0ACC0WH38_9STRA|nr:hypothetical protein PsorP6_012763 [Peronosclerospora sorghi]
MNNSRGVAERLTGKLSEGNSGKNEKPYVKQISTVKQGPHGLDDEHATNFGPKDSRATNQRIKLTVHRN